MQRKTNRSAGTIVALIVLLGLLGLATYVGFAGWNVGGEDKGPGMSSTGYVAMAFGIVATLALGVGLMGLMYCSSKHDRD